MNRTVTLYADTAYRLNDISSALHGMMFTVGNDGAIGATVWYGNGTAGCYTYWLEDEGVLDEFLNSPSLGTWLSDRFKGKKKGPGKSASVKTPFPSGSSINLRAADWRGARKEFVFGPRPDTAERSRQIDAFLASLPAPY